MPRVEDANSLPLAEYVAKYLPAVYDPVVVRRLTNQLHRIQIESSSTISSEHLNSCFNLIATSSADQYAMSSIGWSPAKKLKEMRLPDLRYLLLINQGIDGASSCVEGFISFMLTYEDGHEVIYCYEIHLLPRLQGLGTGKYLMGLMETAGSNAGVEKSMLTVFVQNQAAMKFYDKLGYTKDKFSPEPRKMRNGTVKVPTYVILSKSLAEPSADSVCQGHG
ncbi:MAG: hypothetical protein Q9219_006637 [cf. Caloplaca sp. 3 TL-2023]